MRPLSSDELAEVECLAQTEVLCCRKGAPPCRRCRLVLAVRSLAPEVWQRREGLPVPEPDVPAVSRALAAKVRELGKALGLGPMTQDACIALSEALELARHVEEAVPLPPSPEVGRA